MSLNGFIAAEAGFRCKGGKYSSIFASNAIIDRNTLKDFNPDPVKAKDAVALLKEEFTVISVGKCSATILGTPDKFASAFGVKVENNEIVGLQRFGIISLNKGNKYAELLGEIALSQPGVQLGCPKAPGVWGLCPQDIPQKLSSTAKVDSKGDGINIAVIDSGFDKQHSFWKEMKLDLTKIKIAPDYILVTLSHVAQIYNNWDMEVTKTVSEFKELSRKSNPTQKDKDRLEYLRQLQTRFNQDQVSTFRADFGRFVDQYDPTGHGTAVLANLLSIAPNANITVLKDFQGTIDTVFLLAALRAAVSLQPKPDIISISYGFEVAINDLAKLAPLFNAMQSEIAQATADGITVFWPSGNRGDSPVEVIEIQGQWQDAVIVGGTYFDEKDTLMLSGLAHGYPDGYKNIRGLKAIPDTCGLSGPDKKGYIWVPKASINEDGKEWDKLNGTSLATPQVAALAALIKTAYSAATPENIKEIFIRTSTQVKGGDTAQGKKATEIQHQYDDESFPIGQVNIEKAYLTAFMYDMAKAANDKATIKDAVTEAEQLMNAQ